MLQFRKGDNVGPYVILREIGKGGMATVYEAKSPLGDSPVALKVADGDQSDFLKEEAWHLATLATILDHPNILKILPLSFSEGEEKYYIARDLKTNSWYITLEYADGGSLRDKLEREKIIKLEEVLEIIRQVGLALDYAHSRGIIHRDIKPSNILFKRLPSGKCKVLLSDFGIAKTRDILQKGVAVGTPSYMSPEQAMGEEVDHRSDIYSLGVVLYEMLTGRVPFEGKAPDEVLHQQLYELLPLPSTVNPYIPKSIEAVILKTLARKPDERFQSVKEMVTALEDAAGVSMKRIPNLHEWRKLAELEQLDQEIARCRAKITALEEKYGMTFEEFTAHIRGRATMQEEMDWEE